MHTIFEVNDLSIGYNKKKEDVFLVKDLSFSLSAGQVLALVGQSGSGKTLTADALCGLLKPPLRRLGGHIVFQGKELMDEDGKAWEVLRGRGIFYLFQNPLAALNPTLSVGRQIQEGLIRHFKISDSTSRKETIKLLNEVGLEAGLFHRFPFELSGGMRQRVLLAMALGLRPKILIADEPFTGLDPLRQQEILELLERLRGTGTAILVISHDLRLIFGWADRVMVLVPGKMVEQLPGKRLPPKGSHPYTQSLVRHMVLLEEALRAPA
jgi:ABC-type glutathione transport system ATPase component